MARAHQRKTNEQTRDLIIETACELFYKQGFEVTTFSDIARKVGIAQPSIYAHFKNKMDLQKHACLWAIDQTRRYIDGHIHPIDSALDRLKSYLFSNLHFFRHEKMLAHANMAFYFFSASSPEMLEIFRGSQEKAIQRLEAVLFQAGHEKELNLKEAPLLARSIHSILVGDCYKAIYAASDAEFQKIKSRHWKHVQILLKASLS
jgi:AcrR family transcriptional regulator